MTQPAWPPGCSGIQPTNPAYHPTFTHVQGHPQGLESTNLHAKTGIANLVMYAAGPAIITGHPVLEVRSEAAGIEASIGMDSKSVVSATNPE